MNIEPSNYEKVLKDDRSLAVFLKAMSKFDRKFCELMANGEDFNLTMFVHGDKGELLHCKVKDESFNRPEGPDREKKGD